MLNNSFYRTLLLSIYFFKQYTYKFYYCNNKCIEMTIGIFKVLITNSLILKLNDLIKETLNMDSLVSIIV